MRSFMSGLEAGLYKPFGFELTQANIQLLDSYLRLLDKWNKTYNLTSIRPRSKWVSAHLLDSLSISRILPKGALLDVGSGAGFPGLPIAIVEPERPVILIDRSDKKTSFMRQVVLDLGLQNVNVVKERIEDFNVVEKFQAIVSRAFSDLSQFFNVTRAYCAPEGKLIAMKGKRSEVDVEVQLLPVGVVSEIIELDVPGLNGERHAVVLTPQENQGHVI